MSHSIKYTRIAIADSDHYFKEILIKNLVYPFDSVVKNCNNGYELICQLHKKMEDIFFIDSFMPVISGLETLKYIRKTGNNAPIITYSSVYQEEISRLTAEYQNVFYCQKNTAVILDLYKNYVITPIKKYEDYLQKWSEQPKEIMEYIQRQINESYTPTITEIQIMKLCYQGLSNKEISEKLNLSRRTIETYIARLIKKLKLRNKIDIVRFCVEHGYYNYNN